MRARLRAIGLAGLLLAAGAGPSAAHEVRPAYLELKETARGQFNVTSTGNSVHASVMFNAVSADAVYEEAYGCRLLN